MMYRTRKKSLQRPPPLDGGTNTSTGREPIEKKPIAMLQDRRPLCRKRGPPFLLLDLSNISLRQAESKDREPRNMMELSECLAARLEFSLIPF